MSTNDQGIGIEFAELSVVGVLLFSLIPAYLWVSKAPSQTALFERSAIAGTALVAGAIAYGFSKR